MLNYPLYEFIASVPSCVETTTLAVALEIFAKQQCASLVVVNEQQSPIGLLTCARILTQLLASNQNIYNSKSLNKQQPLSSLEKTLIEPIQTLPATSGVEEFGLFLGSHHSQTHTNLNWALVDSDGKFLGLVDSLRLLQFLAKEKSERKTSQPEDLKPARARTSKRTSAPKKRQSQKEKPSVSNEINCNLYFKSECKPLIQLLERLPWPLMLQTSTGEVVTQNPAWWQQLGTLKNPEAVRQQVEAILEIGKPKKSQSLTQNEPRSSYTNLALKKQLKIQPAISSRCFLDSQPGTCTCVVEVQTGQERIWKFAKIPLDSLDLQISNHQTETLGLIQDSKQLHQLWLVLATDVTEQQQLSKELAAKNADLIQLNRLKDEFLACISHELKTPLTAVLGLSRLLVDQQLGVLNERQARYAGLIHQSGRHLMSVVNDILDLTRMETGQMELTLTDVNLLELCDRAVTEAKILYAQSHKAALSDQSEESASEHQFSLFIQPDLKQMVADELRLRQMLVHLLSNAFKFTETKGEIGLRVSRWEGWVAFTVWDTGIGIPEHQQHLIFQKFQQLENPLTRQFEGTGLGLVLTRALARLHGGDVSFLSAEGKGSHFTLLLPPTPPKISFAEREHEELEIKNNRDTEKWGNKDKRWEHSESEIDTNEEGYPLSETAFPPVRTSSQRLVLIVEAVARYIEDLTEHLTGLGYRVVIARSGCEAVEKARRLQPLAIFLNPLLPLLSGWDVLTLVKSDTLTRHIPVIITATGAEKEQAFANHSDGFLSLPVQHKFLAPLLEILCAIPKDKQSGKESYENIQNHTQLRILRLVNPESTSANSDLLLQKHRVIEVDDLDQGELLARVWHFDVLLLDANMSVAPNIFLEKLSRHPRLTALPLVTCDVATTEAASQISGLTVFPCLTSSSIEKNDESKTNALLSVLQIAAGVCCPPSILVVDLTILPDLPEIIHKQQRYYQAEICSPTGGVTLSCPWLTSSSQGSIPFAISPGSEWFCALIQYLQTAGYKAGMARSWAELLQQIRHKSVDLLLVCAGESLFQKEILSALKDLKQLPFDLPPILGLDVFTPNQDSKQESDDWESIQDVLGGLATQILPRSISMEDLLNQINSSLL